MSSPVKDSFEKTSSQYERKLARQRQLAMMEAAASGTAPSLELDTSDIENDSSMSSGLRSRNETARRFLSDDDEAFFVAQPKPLLSSPTRPSQKASAKSLFDLRGRPDGLPANTGLNLMDHQTGLYREETRMERMMRNVRGMFVGRTGTETFDADAPADDYPDYTSSRRKRQSYFAAFIKSFWADPRRRSLLLLVLGVVLFVVMIAVSTARIIHPSDKVLRQQNSARFNSVMDHIIAQGVTSSALFLDYTAPEHHALRWVAYSDPAKLPLTDPMLMTRYALATFFYKSFLTFEQHAGRQKPVEIGDKQWEGVPNPGWKRKDYWLTEKGVCQWYGVYCTPKQDATGQTVTQYDSNEPPIKIKINKNDMMGQLVPELKSLDSLTLLDLASNKLTGSFPSDLGRLPKLETLQLSINRFSGSLTADFGFLESIKYVDLTQNSFSGPLPKELNRLYNVERFQLSHNNFTGSIPDITACRNLTALHLDHNKLDGTFPFKMALLTNLVELHVNHNSLKGTIPGEIDSIRGLEKFRAENNAIKGNIPRSMFKKLWKLKEVALEYNQLTGGIPDDTSGASQLELVSFSGNKLNGKLPEAWGHIPTLQKLHLNGNALTGTLPDSLGNLRSIKELWLEGNSFKGPIPSELAQCSHLEILFLDSNKLTGQVPSQLGSLSSLKTMRLHGNDIKGTFPAEICSLRQEHHLSSIAADCKSKIQCSSTCCTDCH
jgi:Leucine-rich repeat (LRR) protein